MSSTYLHIAFISLCRIRNLEVLDDANLSQSNTHNYTCLTAGKTPVQSLSSICSAELSLVAD